MENLESEIKCTRVRTCDQLQQYKMTRFLPLTIFFAIVVMFLFEKVSNIRSSSVLLAPFDKCKQNLQ